MRVGVGYADQPDSHAAGAEAARAAMAGLDRCDLVLLFSTSSHDPEALRAGVRSVVGPQPRITGGWAVGTITNDRLGYGGHQVGLAAFRLDSVGIELIAEGPLADAEQAVGRAIGERLAPLGPAPTLLLYDSVNRTTERGKLNMATPLLAGLEQALGGFPPLAGAGLCGDMVGSATRQWVGDEIRQQMALALAFTGDVRMDTVIMHGCEPCTDYHTVTRAEGPVVLEIDGRPAVEVVSEWLGGEVPPQDYGFYVTLGMNMGDKWGAFDEAAYVNRMCLKVDTKRGALVMFEPDVGPGTEIQLMHRSLALDYIAPKVEQAFAGLDGRRPVFALYINCAGRAAAYAGLEDEDAAAVQAAVAGRVPLLGFYSGVEIAEVLGRPRPLDWTGVLCLFSLPGAAEARQGP